MPASDGFRVLVVTNLTNTTSWAAAQAYAYTYRAAGYDVQYPLADTTIGYSNRMERTVKQIAVFGQLYTIPSL